MAQATATATAADIFTRIMDPANRANPYPLYAQLREVPVTPLADGFYAIARYADIEALLHDPRMSKEQRKSNVPLGPLQRIEPRPFLQLDPPEHDRLRRLVMDQFTPARVNGMHDRIVALVAQLLAAKEDQLQIDVVADFAYPLPVTIICEMLGVPPEDEPRFHTWADALAHSVDPDPGEQIGQAGMMAAMQLAGYMRQLIAARRENPGDDLISALATGDDPAGRMDDANLLATLVLLLLAGHETTVNLIANGALTLLRHPEEWDRLRDEPERAPVVIEEMLRFEPPVQLVNRFALTDIEVAGATIPQGSGVRMMLAAGNRDPRRFHDPDRFDPDRSDNQHFGFSSGIHYCAGAPLARIEGQIALTALAHRLANPRLIVDPPPFRPNAILRGPSQLLVEFDRLRD